jgi:hypothetical protein
MKKFLFRLWQWTWGFPQSLVGLIVFLCNLHKPREVYRGCVVTHWDNRGSMGMGMFLFLGCDDAQVRVHEFGHSVQSLILGPLFLPIMGIPSFLWCNIPYFQRMRREKRVSYYRFYPESSANALGAWATGEICDLK